MPIFVSRFSAERIAASGLQRARTQRQPESRAASERSSRADRLAESERERGTQRSERAQDQLPVTTQTAESIREEIESRQQTPSGDQDAERPTFPLQATLPGVSTVSTSTERSAAPQVGRLDQARQNARAGSTSSSFDGLRTAQTTPTTGNARSAEVRQSFRNIFSNAESFSGLQAQRLNAQVDASVRLLRSNGNAAGGPAASADTQASAQPSVIEREAETSVSVETAEPTVTARPNAEQISRANTTPEIQNNLRLDSSEIEQGLRLDAEIEQQENQRQTARTAERAAEARSEAEADANERQVRELSIQERQLEQGLRATQREIRSLNNENNRLESGSPAVTASTVANLANRTTLNV